MGFASHLIQHVQVFTCTNFHACIIKCTIRPIFEVKRLHYRNRFCVVHIMILLHVDVFKILHALISFLTSHEYGTLASILANACIDTDKRIY